MLTNAAATRRLLDARIRANVVEELQSFGLAVIDDSVPDLPMPTFRELDLIDTLTKTQTYPTGVLRTSGISKLPQSFHSELVDASTTAGSHAGYVAALKDFREATASLARALDKQCGTSQTRARDSALIRFVRSLKALFAPPLKAEALLACTARERGELMRVLNQAKGDTPICVQAPTKGISHRADHAFRLVYDEAYRRILESFLTNLQPLLNLWSNPETSADQIVSGIKNSIRDAKYELKSSVVNSENDARYPMIRLTRTIGLAELALDIEVDSKAMRDERLATTYMRKERTSVLLEWATSNEIGDLHEFVEQRTQFSPRPDRAAKAARCVELVLDFREKSGIQDTDFTFGKPLTDALQDPSIQRAIDASEASINPSLAR